MRKVLDTPTHTIEIPDDGVFAGPPRIIPVVDFLDRLGTTALDKIILSNAVASRSFVLRLQISKVVSMDAPGFSAALDRLVPGIISAQERANATRIQP